MRIDNGWKITYLRNSAAKYASKGDQWISYDDVETIQQKVNDLQLDERLLSVHRANTKSDLKGRSLSVSIMVRDRFAFESMADPLTIRIVNSFFMIITGSFR